MKASSMFRIMTFQSFFFIRIAQFTHQRTRWNGENNRIGQKTVVLAEDGQEIKI